MPRIRYRKHNLVNGHPLKQIHLGLAIHNHQPLGNFPWVFEQAYQQAYLPMVESLERHPSIRLSLHYSGCLIDWLEQKHPEFMDRLAGLVMRRQVEIMGAPIMSLFCRPSQMPINWGRFIRWLLLLSNVLVLTRMGYGWQSGFGNHIWLRFWLRQVWIDTG